MKKSNSKQKALGAFKMLGAVALITATIFFVACKQTGGGGGKPTPTPTPTKYTVTLNQTANGNVTASPAIPTDKQVAKDTVITFTATANAGYKVGKWKVMPAEALQAGTGADGSPTAKVKITANTTVSVSFEAIPKHAITFSVDGANGTLKAKADGVDETSTSPINVEEGKTVTFTATPSTGYKVKEWKVGDTVVTGNTSNTYTHTVKKAVTVKVSFEANSNPPNPPTPQTNYTVTLNQTANGNVTASPAIPTDKQVAKDTLITFTAKANGGYKIGKWTVTGSVLEAGTGADGSESAKVKITADTTVSVSFESNGITPNPPTQQGTAILTLNPNKLTIMVTAITADGSAIEVEGCNETTLASNTRTTLTAKGTTVILKGKITELDVSGTYENKQTLTSLNVQGLTSLQKLECHQNQLTELNVQGCTALQRLICWRNQLTELNAQGLTELQLLNCSDNQLTALNVQGCTVLKKLDCHLNKLNAQAMTALLNALPARVASDRAFAVLYTEETGISEGNCKNFTQPEDLKKAFDRAKSERWWLMKVDADGNGEYL